MVWPAVTVRLCVSHNMVWKPLTVNIFLRHTTKFAIHQLSLFVCHTKWFEIHYIFVTQHSLWFTSCHCLCVTQHGLKFIVVTIFLCHTTWFEIHQHSLKLNTKKIIHRQTTHLQLGQDFEFVTSHSVLATVSVSGHAEISARRVSVTSTCKSTCRDSLLHATVAARKISTEKFWTCPLLTKKVILQYKPSGMSAISYQIPEGIPQVWGAYWKFWKDTLKTCSTKILFWQHGLTFFHL